VTNSQSNSIIDFAA